MLRMPAPAFEDDARGLINTSMALRLLWVGVAVCGIGGIASLLEPYHITTVARVVLVGTQVLLALLCAAGTQLVHTVPARVLVLAAAWASVAAASLAALSIGHGAHSLDLSFFPLIVCMVAVLAGTRHALAMAVACALIVVGLAWAEVEGWVAGCQRARGLAAVAPADHARPAAAGRLHDRRHHAAPVQRVVPQCTGARGALSRVVGDRCRSLLGARRFVASAPRRRCRDVAREPLVRTADDAAVDRSDRRLRAHRRRADALPRRLARASCVQRPARQPARGRWPGRASGVQRPPAHHRGRALRGLLGRGTRHHRAGARGRPIAALRIDVVDVVRRHARLRGVERADQRPLSDGQPGLPRCPGLSARRGDRAHVVGAGHLVLAGRARAHVAGAARPGHLDQRTHRVSHACRAFASTC